MVKRVRGLGNDQPDRRQIACTGRLAGATLGVAPSYDFSSIAAPRRAERALAGISRMIQNPRAFTSQPCARSSATLKHRRSVHGPTRWWLKAPLEAK